MRDIYRVIGGEAFVLILDYQTDSASAALVKKLDKDNPEVKTASPVWCRKRLADLASGASAPAEKPAKPKPAPKKEPKGKQTTTSPEQKDLAKALKAIKAEDLAKARDLWREYGAADSTFVLGGLTEIQTRGLAKKLDKDNRDIATGSVVALRERISDLARGTAEPVFKNILEYTSMKVTRTRTPKAK